MQSIASIDSHSVSVELASLYPETPSIDIGIDIASSDSSSSSRSSGGRAFSLSGWKINSKRDYVQAPSAEQPSTTTITVGVGATDNQTADIDGIDEIPPEQATCTD